MKELDIYMKEPYVENAIDGDFDFAYSPCEFWKHNQNRFPNLAPIARDILGVPSSSARIEKIFSTATDIMSSKRNGIKPDMLEMLIFVNRNSNNSPNAQTVWKFLLFLLFQLVFFIWPFF